MVVQSYPLDLVHWMGRFLLTFLLCPLLVGSLQIVSIQSAKLKTKKKGEESIHVPAQTSIMYTPMQ